MAFCCRRQFLFPDVAGYMYRPYYNTVLHYFLIITPVQAYIHYQTQCCEPSFKWWFVVFIVQWGMSFYQSTIAPVVIQFWLFHMWNQQFILLRYDTSYIPKQFSNTILVGLPIKHDKQGKISELQVNSHNYRPTVASKLFRPKPVILCKVQGLLMASHN